MKSMDENGNWITNPKYKEILALHNMMIDAGIPHTFKNDFDGWHIWYPTDYPDENIVISIIEHYGSYGNEKDTLEIMGLLTPEEESHDSVVGYLSAEEVFKRIKIHYEKEEYDEMDKR